MGKSQIDKFNAKLSKKAKDEEVILTKNRERRQAEISRYGAEGVEELVSKGNLKEAAVVFSIEGISAFANMIGNSVESAVIKAMDDRVSEVLGKKMESVFESKMMEVLEGLTEGMRRLGTKQPVTKTYNVENGDTHIEGLKVALPVEEVKELIKDFKDTFSGVKDTEKERISKQLNDAQKSEDAREIVDTPEIDWDKAFAIDEKEKKAIRKGVTPKRVITNPDNAKGARSYNRLMEPGYKGLEQQDSLLRVGMSKEDLEFITPYLVEMLKAYEGQDVRSTDMVRTLQNDFNIKITNPTSVWKRIMRTESNIENVGFGLYKYEEKNFKPTV